MKTLLRILLAALIPASVFGAAGDIKMSQRNTTNTAWTDRIFTTGNNALIGTNASGLESLVTAGTGISISGGVISSTGISGILLGANGGTGVANTGKTITIGGNLTTSGAFNTTLTVTAATGVTLPTTGTLATLAGAEAFSNKAITASTFSGTSVTDSALTSGRVTFASTAGLLVDDADLTFSVDTLTATKFSGALNGTVGATTPSTGSFTTLAATGAATLGSAKVGSGVASLAEFGNSTDFGSSTNYFLLSDTTGDNYINAKTTHQITFLNNGVQKGAVTSTGYQGVIGATTPAAGTFTVLITATSTPASASAAGVAGTITWDASFIYVCVSTNSWKRSALTTW